MEIRSLLLTAAALALCSCAPGGGEDKDGTKLPLGYEMASARDTAPAGAETALVIDLSVAELRERLDTGNVRLIDVRTAEEVAEGRIPGAEHIALDDFDPAKLDLADGREVILYCRSGRRSGIAGQRLAEHTGEPAIHLAGGINAWREAAGETE